MVVFADTSVWIDYVRDVDPALIARMRSLVDAQRLALPTPVRLEVLSGASAGNWATLVEALDPLPLFAPGESTWRLVEVWMERAIRVGQHFGIVDLLIGAIAAEQDAVVWSLDRDFARMAKLGFVKPYEPGETDA